jgi:hypothetical protein
VEEIPCLDSSWLSFTSTRIGIFLPRVRAAALRRPAIFSESMASIALKSSAALAVLLDWSGPMR